MKSAVMFMAAVMAAVSWSGSAAAQSASAPLVETATVVSSCKVNVPRQIQSSNLSTMPSKYARFW